MGEADNRSLNSCSEEQHRAPHARSEEEGQGHVGDVLDPGYLQ